MRPHLLFGVLATASAVAATASSELRFNHKSVYKLQGSYPGLHQSRRRDGGERNVVTIAASRNDTDDVSQSFLAAVREANNGGTLYLKPNETYIIGQKLDLTFLDDFEMILDGELKFTDDIDYWQANNFYYDFQKSITFWKWGGRDIRISGNGVMNGNGQEWYDNFAGAEIL
ncbi:hypothetical protein LTS18_009828, partial [Coniosporium uncinatum]